MKLVVTAFAAMTFAFIAISAPASAQPGPGPGQKGVTVTFVNFSHTSVLVKGYTIVNGTARPGQLLPMKKNDKAYESNVPAGIRFYTVYDPVTQKAILRDHAVPIQTRDVLLAIKTSPTDPTQVVITVVGIGP